MPGVTIRELAVLFETQDDCELHVIEKFEDGKSHWEVMVVLPTQGKTYAIQGIRGRPRTWRSFERMLSFIREACPQVKSIRVTFV